MGIRHLFGCIVRAVWIRGRLAATAGAATLALVSATAVAVTWPTSRPADAAAITHSQVITVRAASATSQIALLEAWRRQPDGVYKRVLGPFSAHVGAAGIGTAREGSTKTPAGQWWLTQSFGINANPGSGLAYFRVDDNDWWNGDSASRYYNRHERCVPGTCPFDQAQSEHLKAVGGPYAYAVVINYNTGPGRAWRRQRVLPARDEQQADRWLRRDPDGVPAVADALAEVRRAPAHLHRRRQRGIRADPAAPIGPFHPYGCTVLGYAEAVPAPDGRCSAHRRSGGAR